MKVILIILMSASFAWANDLNDSTKVQELFQAQADILSQSAKRNIRRGDWQITDMIMDLGLSSGGRFGLLPFKGETAARVYWTHKSSAQKQVSKDRVQSYSLNNMMTLAEVEAQADYIAESILDRKWVTDPVKFKKAMKQLFTDIFVVAHTIAHDPDSPWTPSRLYFDRYVVPSGDIISKVLPRTKFRFRVMWDLSQTKTIALPQELEVKRQKLYPHLKTTLDNMIADLGLVAGEFQDDRVANLRSFSVGLGIGASWSAAGIVKVRTSGMGIIEFNRNESAVVNQEHQQSTAGSYKLYNEDLKTFDAIDRANMREGLRYAFKISGKLYRLARKAQNPNWEVNRLDVVVDVDSAVTQITKLKGNATGVVSFSL